jgi:flagellar biosynthesis component FlhA
MQTVLDLIPITLTDILVFAVAAMLPGMPKSVLTMFGLMIVIVGWKYAIVGSFAYYLLQFVIGGDNAYD